MSSPESLSPTSPVSSVGSPALSPRQTTSTASNGFKVILLGGTLLLMTGASLYVAVTSNFSCIPDIYNNAPHADVPAAAETQERHLNEGVLPWKIREPRPWRINPEKPQQDLLETEQAESKEAQEKKATQQQEKKTEQKEVKKEENPKQEATKKDNRVHLPAKKHNVTTDKAPESPKQPEKKPEQVKAQVKEAVKTKVKEIEKEQAIQKALESAKQEASKTKAAQARTNKTDATQPRTDSTKKKKKPLNILLLYGDDWRHDSLGSASNGLVKTPFLDKLATQGMRFTHNCVTTSVCWVSRATLYTGQYVSRHNSTEPMKPGFYKGWNKTFPYLLREAGYYFGHVGKWHFKDFSEFVKPQLDWERFYYGRHWFEERGGPIHATKRNERDAIDFLRERPKDQPFCLTVCFFTPHAQDGEPEQFFPQNASMALYVNDTIPLAPSATDEAWKKMPEFFVDRNEGRNRYFWRFDTPEKYQKMMKNYYRLISEIDSTSERIVKELEDQGILDETLVIFTTDNGFFHGEHGLADKWYPYQESIRVPMIVRDPRMKKSRIGQLNDDFTLSIDLAPTILGAAGLPTPDVMHGQDFSPLYTEEGDTGESWRKEFFYEHPVHLREDIIPASEALVRKDYKYMLWPNYNVEQLFDLKNDTYELNDLIESESHKELLGEMRTRFNELKKIAK